MQLINLTKNGSGVPKFLGTEVRTASFDIETVPDAQGDIWASINSALVTWFNSELDVVVDISLFRGSSKATLADGAGQRQGSVATVFYVAGDLSCLEVSVITKFHRGIETSRFRFIVPSGFQSGSFEVSSFIESKDRTVSPRDIPRFADSYPLILAESKGLALSVDGVAAYPIASLVDTENLLSSPLKLANKPGKLPIVGFPAIDSAMSTANRYARELFGLAHVVAVSETLFGSLKVSKFSQGKCFVYWREPGSSVEWFDPLVDGFSFKRNVHRRYTRLDLFLTRWRATQQLSVSVPDVSSPVNAEVKELKLQNWELLEQLRVAQESNLRLEADLDSYIATFDETSKRWQEFMAESKKRNAALFAKSTYEDVSNNDFSLHVDLNAQDLEAMFENLENETLGAIAFTERVPTTWKNAKKAGYQNIKVMEVVLEKVCRFAIEYRLAKANLGVSRKQYFQDHFALELIEGDNLPEPDFIYDGEIYSQEPHVHADDSRESFNRLGRIHFAFDEKNSRLIVNHLGSKQYRNKK